MKRSIVYILGAAMLLLSACGVSKPAETPAPAGDQQEATEPVNNETAKEEPAVGMANPWKDTTEEEANIYNPRQFTVPDGASNVHWSMMGSEDEGAIPGPLIQLDFDLDGQSYTARSQYGVGENEDHDISGMYYEWQETEEVTLDNWGGGEMKGTVKKFKNADESAQLCLWYDIEIGIAYSLSVAGPDVSGCDLRSVANSLAATEEFMPGSFVEEKAQKGVFESYDEIISLLEAGQGYTYLELTGYDGEILGISDEIYDYKDGTKAASGVSLYGKGSLGITNIGNEYSEGGDYPLYCGNGLLYALYTDSYESAFITEDGSGMMIKDLIMRSEEDDGKITYTGFLREKNDFDHDEDVPEDAGDLFEQLRTEAQKQPVLTFTVVE